MKVLFLTIGRFENIEAHSIYTDLLRCFRNDGHEVYTVSPYERRTKRTTELIDDKNAHMLHVRTGNVTGNKNLLFKGIAQLTIESSFIRGIKRYFSNVKFDLILYSTPPISLVGVIKFIKKRDGAKSYLLLKDIFPQNAVDLGLMSTHGVKGIIYIFFRKKEIRLYKTSDYIGCMSEANKKYLLDHNRYLHSEVVEICPNSVEIVDKSIDEKTKAQIRLRYGIPNGQKTFIFGGNLGKPQGIPFLIECLKKCKDYANAFFLIIGDGSEYMVLEKYIIESRQANIKLIKRLPKNDYDSMVGACDVGLIFLDHRFSIPNFPSRLLSYMQAKIPVFAVTDCNSDIGKVVVDGGFGWWCESNNSTCFVDTVKQIVSLDSNGINKMIRSETEYLHSNFDVKCSYKIIMDHFG